MIRHFKQNLMLFLVTGLILSMFSGCTTENSKFKKLSENEKLNIENTSPSGDKQQNNTSDSQQQAQQDSEGQTGDKDSRNEQNSDNKNESNAGNPTQDNGEINKENDKNIKADKNRFDGIKVRAVYLTGSSAGSSKMLERIIELSKTTELNAVVIDVKDDYGKVNYQTEFADAKQIGAFHKLYNPDNVIKLLHDNSIYVIGRIVVFKDPLLGEKRADMAIKRPNGQIYREKTVAWVNPYNEDVWKYNIEIAKEAVNKGFDEIQFDYVRFPAARTSDVNYGENPPPKTEAIGGFLKEAEKELHEGKGAVVSADVFGIICESPGDFEGLGQDIEKIGMDVDYICPMVYPSHYANKSQNGSGQKINGVAFTAPDLEPYNVVYQSLAKAKNRTSAVSGYKAMMRPYLQAFTASWLKKGYYKKYTAEDVRQQIKAVYDAGYEEWILWDSANKYLEEYFAKK